MKTVKTVVIMGGSFNPPTLAHLRIMQAAVQAVDAEKGIFVPVSHAYLKRKMRKNGTSHLCFPDHLRMKMLETMCAEDERLEVSDLELYEVKAVTYETMSAFSKQYPQAFCYFVAGADKLELFSQMAEYSDFLERFGIVLFYREGIDVEKEIESSESLRKNRESIVLVPQTKGMEQISSTAVRKRMLSGESLETYVCPATEELLKSVDLREYPEEICQFKEEYEFLSNRYTVPFIWKKQTFATVDAAFKTVQKTLETDEEQIQIMEEIVRCKFEQNPELKEKLLETKGKILIAGSSRKDVFWGVNLYS